MQDRSEPNESEKTTEVPLLIKIWFWIYIVSMIIIIPLLVLNVITNLSFGLGMFAFWIVSTTVMTYYARRGEDLSQIKNPGS